MAFIAVQPEAQVEHILFLVAEMASQRPNCSWWMLCSTLAKGRRWVVSDQIARKRAFFAIHRSIEAAGGEG